MESSRARVVIIMPVYNEARHLDAVLQSLDAQTFDRNRLYVIAVDGGSSDASVEKLRTWLEGGSFSGCVLSNPQRKIPISLNLALGHAAWDDIVVRLDAHTIYGATYVADVVRALESADPAVGCVGGAQRPMPAAGFQQRLVEALYTNPLGLGSADFRMGEDVREVDSVYLGAWRPGVLKRAGGFNEGMEANEDGELAARLRKMGYRIVRIPLKCKFIVNRGIWASIRQWNRYGYWRAKMLRRHPGALRMRHVVSCASAVLAVALAFSPLRIVLLPAYAAYAIAVFRGRAKGEPLHVTLTTLAYFPCLQFAFAAGMLAGLPTAAAAEWPAGAPAPASATIKS